MLQERPETGLHGGRGRHFYQNVQVLTIVINLLKRLAELNCVNDGHGLSMLNGFVCKVDDSEVSFMSVIYSFKPCEEVSRIYFVLTTV